MLSGSQVSTQAPRAKVAVMYVNVEVTLKKLRVSR